MTPADTNQVEDGSANSSVSTKSAGSGAPTEPRIPNKLLQKEQNRRTQSYKVEAVSRRTVADAQNFSLENKRESEYVSQRSNRHQASVAGQTLRFLPRFFFFGGARGAFTNQCSINFKFP